MGLAWFLSHPKIDLFWVLNPDSMVTPDTAAAYVQCAALAGPFSLMGARSLSKPRGISSLTEGVSGAEPVVFVSTSITV